MGTTFGPFLDPRIDRCGFLPKRFQQAVVVDRTGMRTPTFGGFLERRRDRCGFFPKRFQQAVVVEGTGMGTQTSGRFLDPRLDLWIFAKRFQQTAVVDGTGMRTPTFGGFLDPRLDLCGFSPKRFQQAVVVERTGMGTQTSGHFLDPRRDLCGFFQSDFSGRRSRYAITDLRPLSRPPSRPLWMFAKRFQQAVVIDGTGIGRPTLGRFLDRRLYRCDVLLEGKGAMSASRRCAATEGVRERQPLTALSTTFLTAANVFLKSK